MSQTLRLRYPGRAAISVIRVREGGLAHLGREVRRVCEARRAVLVTEPKVASLHGSAALRGLRNAGIEADLVSVSRGERAKHPVVLARLWERLAQRGLERGDLVVALGGGAVGDLAGFAAATWMRGVAWYAVPTTVVAQVDSTIGGKTGIDLRAGKNLAGAFHHPLGVLVDPRLLDTLPTRDYRAGLAEIAKVAFATDAAFFARLERVARAIARRDPRVVLRAIGDAIAAKARVVLRDEREREGGGRTALNFGHTLGHALEAASGYRLRHGEAVAVGMRFAARLSVRHAGLAPEEAARLEALLDAWGLPRTVPGVNLARVERGLLHDKKRRNSELRWVLTPRVGRASVPRLVGGRVVRAALLDAFARRRIG